MSWWLEYYKAWRPGEVARLDDAQAWAETDLLWQALRLGPGLQVLDVGCGYGRHALHLAQRGCSVTGVDASPEMLERAKEAARKHSLSIRFVRADMREMTFAEPFDAAYFMGGGFGIFGDEGDLETLRAAGRAVKPGARLLIDLPNPWADIARLVQQGGILRDWSDAAGGVQVVDVEFDPRTCMGQLRKTIVAATGRQERSQQWRSYVYPELRRMLEQAGFAVTGDYGDYGGGGLTLCSARMIVVGQRQ